MKTLFLFLLFPFILFAQNITLKDSTLYKNVLVLDTAGTIIKIQFNDVVGSLAKSTILSIDKSNYNPSQLSQIIPPKEKEIVAEKRMKSAIMDTHIKKIMPNTNIFYLSILSAAIAWDYFSQSSNLSDQITNYQQLKLDTSTLQSEQSRKVIIGVVASVICVVTAIVGFQSVEVNAENSSLTLSYRF